MPSKKQNLGVEAESMVAALIESKTALVRRKDLEERLGRGPHKTQIDLVFAAGRVLYLIEVKAGHSIDQASLVDRFQLKRQANLALSLSSNLQTVRCFLAMVDLAGQNVVFLENPC